VTATNSWAPTPTEKVEREVDYQLAAATEREHPPGTERISLTKECGWKDGDSGGLAEWEQTHGKKKVHVCLESIKAGAYRCASGTWASERSPHSWPTFAPLFSTIQSSHFPELRGARFPTISHVRRKSLQGRERESI